MDNGTLMLNGTSYSGNGGTLVVNGVNYSGGGGVDVSDTTATPEDVLLGKIFHLANGDRAEGTLVPPKVASGEFDTTASIVQEIELGFKPRFIYIYTSYGTASIYYADKSTTTVQQWNPTTASTQNLPNTAVRCINSVTDTGFTFKTPSNVRNQYWIAIG